MRYVVIQVQVAITGQPDFYAVVDTAPSTGVPHIVGRFVNQARATEDANARNGV